MLLAMLSPSSFGSDHLFFEAGEGPGAGKHVVFISGDEEYRSEEAMPMLAGIAARHGFKSTVLFSLDENGIVNPDIQSSLAHSEALDSADAIVMAIRFRNWDDVAMQRFEDALLRGVPIIALRTSTHAFKFPSDSKWARYSFRASEETGWKNGFGKEILGETWVSHHGKHKVEGTRSKVESANSRHPILNGVGEIFGDSDVYTANPPIESSTILLRGEVTQSLAPDSPALKGKKNNPMQPIAWTRKYQNEAGKTNRVFTTTMGAATDLLDGDLRRLVLNAIYWGLELNVPPKADVVVAESYDPTMYGFGGYKKGLRPVDFIVGDAIGDGQAKAAENRIEINDGERIVIVGNGLGSRMTAFGYFETEMHLRKPQSQLVVRNMCDEGNTPSFRPHSSRSYQLGFPGAENFHEPYTGGNLAEGIGHFPTEEEWLSDLKPDTIIAFFGFSESFIGLLGISHFEAELDAFLKRTSQTAYNAVAPPQVVLISPIAVEDRSGELDVPNGEERNAALVRYVEAMKKVAGNNDVLFVNVFDPSRRWYQKSKDPLTNDGTFLNELGYRKLGAYLADVLAGPAKAESTGQRERVRRAVLDKDWFWLNDFKIPNGVHAYGQRFDPFGPENYPDEVRKTREMTTNRDRAIWALLAGTELDLQALDAETHRLPPVPTNYKIGERGGLNMLYGSDALDSLTVPDGYKVDQWASEQEFPDLANPVQLSFDGQGRLWVAVMPSYPHYRPGDSRPNDKLLILEDTDNDGQADKQSVWADGLHLPLGFEIAAEGVYVSQERSLVLLKDTNGDGKADTKEITMSGFDDHDTHHAIGAFCADPSGAIFLSEGLFLRSHIETAYGTVRGSNGGFYRYTPQRRHLDRIAQLRIPNPWGVAFDDWGQPFFLHTSNTRVEWMLPGTVYSKYGYAAPRGHDLIEKGHRVRPTAGLEFLYSRHFPDEVQGDLLLCNTIGFRGIKQHRVMDEGTGYKTTHRQDLLKSSDPNFRPVDLEVAPDGSLYVVDWYNPLIGHMQHNARDPNRDHAHGRIYRITYPSRSLVAPMRIEGASIEQLLENTKSYEYRGRHRNRRELRGRDPDAVVSALSDWIQEIDFSQPETERLALEALWISWGANRIDESLLLRLLESEDYRIRAAAVYALRFNEGRVEDFDGLLRTALDDPHGRVRLSAMTAASWLGEERGLALLEGIEGNPGLLDEWSKEVYRYTIAQLNDLPFEEKSDSSIPVAELEGSQLESFQRGYEIYGREGHCATCHQEDGKGLPSSGFPSLQNSPWVTQSPERLVKLTLNGLHGPMEVNGETLPGLTPMTPFRGILNDQEVADVLTYVRNAFDNRAPAIESDQVARVRSETADKVGFYSPAELLEIHPHEGDGN